MVLVNNLHGSFKVMAYYRDKAIVVNEWWTQVTQNEITNTFYQKPKSVSSAFITPIIYKEFSYKKYT